MRNYLSILLGLFVTSLTACNGSLQTKLGGVTATQFQEKRIPLFVEKENPDIFQINLGC